MKFDKYNKAIEDFLFSPSAVGLFVGLAAILSVILGNAEFSAYDASLMIDTSWRLYEGQTPYLDFVSTLPPTLYMFGALGLKLFGVHWYAFTLMDSLLFIVLSGLGVWAIASAKLTEGAGADKLLPWVYVIALFVPLISTNHIWHSTLPTAFAAYIFLATFLLCEIFEKQGQLSKLCLLHVFLAAVGLFLSKPNTAFPAIVIAAAVCILRLRLFVAMICTLCLAACGACLLLLMIGIHPTDVFISYVGISSRAWWQHLIILAVPNNEHHQVDISIITFAMCVIVFVGLAVAGMYSALDARRFPTHASILAVGGVGLSVVGFATNWDLRTNDIGGTLLGIGIFVLATPGLRRMEARAIVQRTLLALCIIGLVIGVPRLRMKLAGQWAGDGYGELTMISNPFFGDFITHEGFENMLVTADKVMKKIPARHVFFGPRLEFMYAQYGIDSPKHLPVWWHPGASYVMSDEDRIIKSWEDSSFDLVIFAGSDHTRIPKKLLEYLVTHYQRYNANDLLDVWLPINK